MVITLSKNHASGGSVPPYSFQSWFPGGQTHLSLKSELEVSEPSSLLENLPKSIDFLRIVKKTGFESEKPTQFLKKTHIYFYSFITLNSIFNYKGNKYFEVWTIPHSGYRSGQNALAGNDLCTPCTKQKVLRWLHPLVGQGVGVVLRLQQSKGSLTYRDLRRVCANTDQGYWAQCRHQNSSWRRHRKVWSFQGYAALRGGAGCAPRNQQWPEMETKNPPSLSPSHPLAIVMVSAFVSRRAAPSAEFSVDRTRHLMSFLTMMGPSPDWNVGLSAEDLCTKECGWVQKLVQDLIPWDAGTDSGVTYESPNKPTIPQEKIRPLTSLDHPQSPFYDPEGGSITQVARVVIERIARKGEQCNIVPDNVDDIVADLAPEEKDEDDTPETCIYSNWSPWSACSSSTCDKGKRMRQRMLKAQLDLSVPCPDTQDFQPCMGPGCSDEDGSTCTMSEWITWSPCSISCGTGMRSRERYVKQFPEDGSVCTLPTEETEKCTVNEECSPSSCLTTEWGEWDECSATCGMGMKKRHRMVKMSPADGSMCKAETSQAEKCMMPECHTIPCLLSLWSEWSDCSVTCGKGMRTRQRMLKSLAELGDCNEELEQVEKCMLPECPIDCELTEWSQWSECNKSCGKGHMIRTRMIQMEPQFGGTPCPETVQRKKCRIRKCLRNPSIQNLRWREARESRRSEQLREESDGDQFPGCRLRPWTAWSECTKLCGGGIQERYMTVKKRFKSSQFTSCKDKKEIRACNVHPC
ncbi:hypothetical protein FD755_017310 [Muntiacus reevesi]|uniref:Spondin-1 n=1 Tax=Muntiacus reevesi TaxID=9886 RepID=A0A5N3X9N3_MUNRE|nr:hypothetical protein FD755_017310 [Muntiacus reevesi]